MGIMEMIPTEAQLNALVEAGVILASELNLAALLQQIADFAREVVGASYSAVVVVGEQGEIVRFVYSGMDKDTADRIGDLPRGRGVLGALLEQDRPLRVREISDHSRSCGFPKNHPPMHTFLGVPIVVGGRVFGRLYLTEKHGGDEFTEDDELIATTLASQAGVAIENVHLYDEIRTRSDELARRVQELSSVKHVGDLLTGGATIDKLLRSAAAEALKLTKASRCMLLLLDEFTGELVVREAVGVSPAADLVGTRLAPASSKAHAALTRKEAEAVEDLAADPEVSSEFMQRLGNPHSAAFVPLVVGPRGLGTLAVYDRTDGRPFSSDDLSILQLLANQAAIALENDRLTEVARNLAVLEERERIAKELHDGVIQSIYSVGMALKGSTWLLRRDPELAHKRIDQSVVELDNVVRDVRSYIFGLSPKLVVERGLEGAIYELVKDLEVNTLARAHVDLHPGWYATLDEEQQRHVIQIVREILSNVARHGHASEVRVTCSTGDDGEVIIEIADDGVGFDPDKVERGRGLTNIEQRTGKLGGVVTMMPRHPQGMSFTVRIPSHGSQHGRSPREVRVMLVDDHEVVRQGLRALLEAEEGIEVVAEAASGKGAVDLARIHHPEIVVMDVRMPDGSGVEACRQIRDKNPETQVIMLTSFSDDEALFNSIMAGAAGFVLKQNRGDDLVNAIRRVGAGQSLLDPGVTSRVLERLRKAKFDEGDPKLARLSPQERRILDMIGEGLTNIEIAERIGLSDNTVKHYVSTILQKLEVARRVEAASYVVRARASGARGAGTPK